MPLVNGAKSGVNPGRVFSNVITPKSAAYLQPLLLTLPIIEILESFSPGLETDFQCCQGRGLQVAYFWHAGYPPYCSKSTGDCL